MDLLEGIVNAQKEKKKKEMYTEAIDGTKSESIPLFLVIFDDIIGDKELKSFQSELSSYCTRSRHANILNIFLTQDWNALPTRIRRNSNLVFLMNMDTYPDNMIKENSTKNTEKQLEEAYQSLVGEKRDFSFIIIDKGAPMNKRFFFCKEGKECIPLDLKKGVLQ